eukprot:349667-Chlamydomonas_euryale.AAC.4
MADSIRASGGREGNSNQTMSPHITPHPEVWTREEHTARRVSGSARIATQCGRFGQLVPAGLSRTSKPNNLPDPTRWLRTRCAARRAVSVWAELLLSRSQLTQAAARPEREREPEEGPRKKPLKRRCGADGAPAAPPTP